MVLVRRPFFRYDPVRCDRPMLYGTVSERAAKTIRFNTLWQWKGYTTGLILLNIIKTAQDIYTITIKQIVRFQERMHFEKIQLFQVQNGRQSAIIHFHMADIWSTVLDG